jgi:NAD+ kinase
MPGRRGIVYKKKIRKVVVVCRRNSPGALELGREVADWLADHKISVFHQPGQPISPKVKLLKSASDLDLVVVLGGDGTYLEAVRLLGASRVPLLGINMGSLGFLTVMRSQDAFQMLELAINGELELKSRSMIRISLRRAGKIRDQYTALNDLVIERGGHSHLIHIAMTVDKLPITSIKADGLILATPTGSTAYNLAAGGPILHPEVNALVATPICPHSLTSRPFIFPDERKLQLSLVGREARAMLTVDGKKKATLDSQDEVTIERETSDHLFLRKMGHNYFSLLKEKLKFGERA